MEMSDIGRTIEEIRCRHRGDVPKILSTEESLNFISEHRVSVSRFGDGEFDFACGLGCAFQNASEGLSRRLSAMLRNADENERHKIAIPLVMSTLRGYTYASRKWWLKYFSRKRSTIQAMMNMNYTYLDAQISRIYINRRNKEESSRYFELWKALWNKKRILVVEGKNTAFGFGNDLMDNAEVVRRIIGPSRDAYDRYRQIYDSIEKNAKGHDIVLLALGPTATLLAKDLADAGIWAIDSGNLDLEYEWCIRKTTKKIMVAGKDSPEAKGEMLVAKRERAYEDQIIDRIL